MNDSKAYVTNSGSLRDLGHSIEMFSDSLAKLASSLESYIDGVLEEFKRQREIVARQVSAAEEVLSAAEDAASSCHLRQRWDEEDQCYRPSCRSEERAVEVARDKVEQLQKILNKVDDILREYEKEKEEFYARPGFITPAGAGYCLKWLAETHSDNARKALDKVIDDVEKYERFPMSIKKSSVVASGMDVSPCIVNECPDEKRPSKVDLLNAAREKIKERQAREIGDGCKADVVVKCPSCKRPLSMCICPRKRELER